MNSLSDLLTEKAENLFPVDDVPTPVTTEQASAIPSDAPQTLEKIVDITTLRAMIYTMKGQLDAMLRVLDNPGTSLPGITPGVMELGGGERIIEGKFTGEKMLGDDGKEYTVPPNYASKSKIVEGDRMKLTITKSGSFIYKQIGPVERKRAVGELVSDANSTWTVLSEGKTYKVLTASVTFYKGKAGDEVILLLPRDTDASWGAVENIINR